MSKFKEALNKFRLPEDTRLSRKLILALLLTSGAIANTPPNAQADNFNLTQGGQKMLEGKAIGDALSGRGRVTIVCEDGKLLFQGGGSNSPIYWPQNPSESTIVVPSSDERCDGAGTKNSHR